MKINIIFALENTCNVLCNSIIRSWKIMRYTRFIIMRSPVQSRFPLQKFNYQAFKKVCFLDVFFVYVAFYAKDQFVQNKITHETFIICFMCNLSFMGEILSYLDYKIS